MNVLIEKLKKGVQPSLSEVIDFFLINNPASLLAVADQYGIFADQSTVKNAILEYFVKEDERNRELFFTDIASIEYVDNVPGTEIDSLDVMEIQKQYAGENSPILRVGGWLATALTAAGAILPVIGDLIGQTGQNATVTDPVTGQKMTMQQYQMLQQQRQREQQDKQNRRILTGVLIAVGVVGVGLIIWSVTKK